MAKKGAGGGKEGGPAKPRRIEMQPEALEDLRYWVQQDRRIAMKILDLIEAARRDPFGGIGKPEPLRHLGADIWSRRITQEDRLIYRVTDSHVDVIQARYHY
jgi:toxin YoeB